MKYKDLKKIKPGDKVVVEVQKIDQHDPNRTVNIGGWVFGGWIPNYEILKVYHEPEKIKMTVEEKKEFDELKKTSKALYLAFLKIAPLNYPRLYHCLFGGTSSENNRNQLGFARAWGNPELVEVEKPKKYYVHLFPGENGYLIYFKNDKRYVVDAKGMGGQPVFTKDEIEEINCKHSTFEIKPEALEEDGNDE